MAAFFEGKVTILKFMLEDVSKYKHDGGIHIEDEPIGSLGSSDSSDNPKFIHLDQVKGLLEASNEVDDQGVTNYVQKHQSFILEHKIKRVNKYIDTIRMYWEDATPCEMIVAFDEANFDIDEFIIKVLNPKFKPMIQKLTRDRLQHKPPPKIEVQESDNDHEDDAYIATEEEDENFSPQIEEEVVKVVHHRHTKSNPTHHGKIPPPPKGVDPKTWENWSDARRQSYLRADNYPNAYYYRHLPPGEKQINGSWSNEEKALFMKRVKEFRGNSTTMNGDWGLFSLTIPGRVGYQCSNFYRKLVEAGEIYDSNYVRGEGGKIHHKSRIHDGKIVTSSQGRVKRQRYCSMKFVDATKIKSVTLVYFTDEDNIPMNEHMSRYDGWASLNPIPNMIDDITGEKIRVPAISPDGYVLDYNTWISTLKDHKENPFTRAPVTKRQLIILTHENIDEYKDKIVNYNNGASQDDTEEK